MQLVAGALNYKLLRDIHIAALQKTDEILAAVAYASNDSDFFLD